MMGHGDTEVGARRTGKHIEGGYWQPVKRHGTAGQFVAVHDKYTASSNQPVRRKKTTRAWPEQWGQSDGKHHLDIMREGLAKHE